jgi:hypothetical protein
MAARKTTTMSRRRAVVALGAGVLGSTVAAGAQAPKTAPAAAAASVPPKKLDTKSCIGRNTSTKFGNARERKQLQLETCCVYLKDVLEHGIEHSQPDPKRLLQPFMDLLTEEARRDALLDYCYVQFDLTEEQLKSFRDLSARMFPGAPAK